MRAQVRVAAFPWPAPTWLLGPAERGTKRVAEICSCFFLRQEDRSCSSSAVAPPSRHARNASRATLISTRVQSLRWRSIFSCAAVRLRQGRSDGTVGSAERPLSGRSRRALLRRRSKRPPTNLVKTKLSHVTPDGLQITVELNN